MLRLVLAGKASEYSGSERRSRNWQKMKLGRRAVRARCGCGAARRGTGRRKWFSDWICWVARASQPQKKHKVIHLIILSHRIGGQHIMFRATSRLLECRITLFTRVNCSLCDTAKAVVGNVKMETPFAYREIDVMQPGQEKWRDVYEFDTPVVCTFALRNPRLIAESSDPC